MEDIREELKKMMGDGDVVTFQSDCGCEENTRKHVGALCNQAKSVFYFGYPHNDTVIDGIHTTEPIPAFLGVKIVGAYPMLKSAFDKLQNRPCDNCEDMNGYLVMYEDGYKSWSPASTFSKAYRRIDGLTFGLAIEALKQGKRVARKGWNGKGMWLRYVNPYNNDQFTLEEKEIDGTFLPWIGMKTADNGFVPWLASQTDMLAEDWEVVE